MKRNRRVGGRHKLTHSPPRHRWTARGLLAGATVLLVWSGTSLVADQDVVQVAQERVRVYEPVLGAPLNRGALEAPPPPNPYIEPPLNQPGKPARVGPGEIQAPTTSVGAESIEIPALDIKRDLIELGVVGSTLQVPDKYADVGWWRDGPVPGEKGASVMVGHVDSPTGPAVFYQLSGLRDGDRINVGLEDGSRTVFEVRDVRVYDRTEFPSARVYRREGPPGLNLITCGGSFDTEAGLYTSNVVVFTELVERIPAKTERPPKDAPKQQSGKQQSGEQQSDKKPSRPVSQPKWYERLVDDSRKKLQEKDTTTKPNPVEGVLP